MRVFLLPFTSWPSFCRLPASAPRVRLVDWEIAAVNIFEEGLLMAPAYAIPRLLSRNRLGLADVNLWEIHEAFAAQACAVARDLGFDPRKTNPNGGAVALGHPVGATGIKQLLEVYRQMKGLCGEDQLKSIPTFGATLNMGGDDKTAVCTVLKNL